MNRELALDKLVRLQDGLDTECDHGAADQVLCDLLTALGYSDVVEEYDKVEKWYA